MLEEKIYLINEGIPNYTLKKEWKSDMKDLQKIWNLCNNFVSSYSYLGFINVYLTKFNNLNNN